MNDFFFANFAPILLIDAQDVMLTLPPIFIQCDLEFGLEFWCFWGIEQRG